jgi:hypothetical protein
MQLSAHACERRGPRWQSGPRPPWTSPPAGRNSNAQAGPAASGPPTLTLRHRTRLFTDFPG